MKPTTKFGQLPLLEVDGETYAQSSAILAYVGKLTGMYPSAPLVALKTDELLGVHEDLMAAIRPSLLVMRDEKLSLRERQRRQAEMRKAVAEKNIPETFARYERMLETSGKGWFIADKPTIADMAVLAQLRWLTSGLLDGVPKSCIDGYPRLKAFFMRASSHPEVEKWYTMQKK